MNSKDIPNQLYRMKDGSFFLKTYDNRYYSIFIEKNAVISRKETYPGVINGTLLHKAEIPKILLHTFFRLIGNKPEKKKPETIITVGHMTETKPRISMITFENKNIPYSIPYSVTELLNKANKLINEYSKK